jgi:hypothetical protein
MTMGKAFLDSGDIVNAATMFRSAGLDVDPNVLTQSPAMQLKKAQTEEALRALTAKKKAEEEIRALVAPKTVETPVTLGIGGEIPEGVEVPTTKTTVPGRDVTIKDMLQIIARNDPLSGLWVKGQTLQTGIESAMEKLKMMADHYKALEAIGARNADARNLLALAAMTRADKYEGGRNSEALIKVSDPDTGEVTYVPRSQAAGQKAPGGPTAKQVADAETKILANPTKKEAAALVDLVNKDSSKNYRYEWKPGRLWGGEWVQVPKNKTGGSNADPLGIR